MTEALVGFGAFLSLSFLRVPLAFAMGAVGFFGFAYIVNFHAAGAVIAQTAYETGLQYPLSVIPLFVLMGNLVVRAGLSDELFNAAYTFVGHKRGGLALSTIIASAGFGSVCGSSIATAATFSKIAYPSMKRMGYADSLATGCISSGGTLGILIPPSVVLVLYGIITGTSIGHLFAAGIIPGILLTIILCLTVSWVTWRNPEAGPAGGRSTWAERRTALRKVGGVLVLFLVVMGGIYGGVFTATEGAAVGAGGAFLFALARRSLSVRIMLDVLVESVTTTSMIFLILIGALILANFFNMTSMPDDMKNLVTGWNVHPIWVMVAIFGMYIVLGAAMEEISMILLTVPVFFPLVTHLGFSPVWFGVSIIIIVMIGMISPPIGMNIFVIRTLLPGVPLMTVFRGVMPFVVATTLMLPLLLFFPQMATWLPSLMR